MLGIAWSLSWVLPALNLIAFLGALATYRIKKGIVAAGFSLVAIFAAFVVFWFLVSEVLENGFLSDQMTWFQIAETKIIFGFYVDRLTLLLLGLITFVALIVQVYSFGYMKKEPRFGWFFTVNAFFVASMLALVLADNLLFLYFAWELVGLGSYLLIGFWYERRSAAEAAKKAFITTRIGDVALLIGIIVLFKSTGTFQISTIIDYAQSGLIGSETILIASILIFLGAMGKSAQVPFHVWLPDAMEGPTPVSALIHAATMVVAGVYLVTRMLPLFEISSTTMWVVTIVGMSSFLLAACMAMVMHDIKRVLAYSTISHLGLMMFALGCGAASAAVVHLLAHGVGKAILFLCSGNVSHSLDGETNLMKMGGLLKKLPLTAVLFLIGSISLAGIFPLAGFFSKDEIISGVLDGRGWFFVGVLLIGTVLSSLYLARLWILVFFKKSQHQTEVQHQPNVFMKMPLIVLAIPTVVFGISLAQFNNSFFGLHAWFIEYSQHHFNFLIAILSTLAALLGVFIAWVMIFRKFSENHLMMITFKRIEHILIRKFFFDDFYQFVIDKIILIVANMVALLDRKLVNDILVDGLPKLVYSIGRIVRVFQSGQISHYAFAMIFFASLIFAGWWLLVTNT